MIPMKLPGPSMAAVVITIKTSPTQIDMGGCVSVHVFQCLEMYIVRVMKIKSSKIMHSF